MFIVIFCINMKVPNIIATNNIKNPYEVDPDNLRDIPSTPIPNIILPKKILTTKEIMNKGKEIKLNFAYNDPNWVRPAYRTYWHPSVSGGRWSNVPKIVNYALHDIFTVYPTASIYYDFIHDLGIDEESNYFIDNDVIFKETIILVLMNSNIIKLLTYGNQVLVIVEPSRTGLQVLKVSDMQINPIDKNSPIMFQLVTPDGYELDYNLINLL